MSALNTGIHSSTLRPSPIGLPKRTGSFPGASGAQFIGKEIQEPQPKPQASPSAIVCAILVTSVLSSGLASREAT